MILVTGATGINGSEIVKQLVAAGAQVRALVHAPQKAAEIAGINVEIVTGDFDHPASLDAALTGVDRALLLSANTQRQVEQDCKLRAGR